ncbi:RNA polymerase sigma factor, sigma-70 family [Promicromonospora umidemergens]|uniref:RNA polymerase sigma factor n=1 Tax=Promicromonospora umidemergens TaxID=629679 RepID=A0ABP8XNJ8_9MICO|nr:sigma-70 family RNA polymerase sigma factor [Promicromonospora umidemergens]MCP2281938.1 RNA polymerase sigma factor, sigma-70 family [Promicromonospora umidemergens]
MDHDAVNDLMRTLAPQVLGALVRRGADFATAEDAVQESLIEAVHHWPDDPPDDPKAWLLRVAGRKLIDAQRSEAARRRREERVHDEPPPGPAEQSDDTLLLLSRCCHPALSPASAVALTLRAVGGLTTAQIARAFLVPEATMAQRISRAKRTITGERFDTPGDVGAVLHVLYLIFNEGFTGEISLAGEAIRLTRQLAAATSASAGTAGPEIAGLLALMLLHHARRDARRTASGELVPLDQQDRSRWDTDMVAEGVDVLQDALARDRLGQYQAQAAIAALHDDAPTAQETDWSQILQWYDELARLTDNPVVALNRAVAVGQVDGPRAGLAVLNGIDPGLARWDAVAAHLYERADETAEAIRHYTVAADRATSSAERNHLIKQAARLRSHGSRPPA